MNLELVDKVARATLYEGYILYPYRASAVKNRQRFNFGGVYPPTFSQFQAGLDACQIQTECLVQATETATLDVRVRFLHLRSREIGRLTSPRSEVANISKSEYQIVDSLQIDGKRFQTWQEAEEREIVVPELNLKSLTTKPHHHSFSFGISQGLEPLRNAGGQIVAVAVRRQEAIVGSIVIQVTAIGSSLYKVRAVVANETPFDEDKCANRDDALARSFASTHTILGVRGGEFVSLFDPADEFRVAVASCENVGTWPVLVGEARERDTLLSSPIILYDYPQLAPESAGELFDGTEIDEILTLRIMTLTDEEKNEMRSVDDRAREILERTELMPKEQLMKMHGAMRALQPSGKDRAMTPWDDYPFDAFDTELSDRPRLESVRVGGKDLRAGDRVRLWPQQRADIMDMAMQGKIAIIEAIEQDFEERVQLAVVIEDDPGRDLGYLRQIGHRFFFLPAEVEPLFSKDADAEDAAQ